MKNIDLIYAHLVEIVNMEFNVIYYSFIGSSKYFDLLSLKNDEINLFLENESLNKIGSKITLIVTKENPEVIGFMNRETSHMILFKNKVEFVGVKVSHNYYGLKMYEFGTTKRKVLDNISKEEDIIDSQTAILVLISVVENFDCVKYVFQYFDSLGYERYATYVVENKEDLIPDPELFVTTVKGVINDGVVEKVFLPHKNVTRKLDK